LALVWLYATAVGQWYYYDEGALEIVAAVGAMYALIVLLRAICILVLRTARRWFGSTTPAP
jgi:hypothetical protein